MCSQVIILTPQETCRRENVYGTVSTQTCLHVIQGASTPDALPRLLPSRPSALGASGVGDLHPLLLGISQHTRLKQQSEHSKRKFKMVISLLGPAPPRPAWNKTHLFISVRAVSVPDILPTGTAMGWFTVWPRGPLGMSLPSVWCWKQANPINNHRPHKERFQTNLS